MAALMMIEYSITINLYSANGRIYIPFIDRYINDLVLSDQEQRERTVTHRRTISHMIIPILQMND